MHSGSICLAVVFAALMAAITPAAQAMPSPKGGIPKDAGTNQDKAITGKGPDGKDYYLCLDADPASLTGYPTTPLGWALMTTPTDSCRITSYEAFSGKKSGDQYETTIAHRGPLGNYFFSTGAGNIFSTSFSSYISNDLNVQIPDASSPGAWDDSPHSMYPEGHMWRWKFMITNVSGDQDQSLDFNLLEDGGNVPRWINIIDNPSVTKNPAYILSANPDKGTPTTWTIKNF